MSLPFRKGEIVAGKYEIGDLIGVGGIGFIVDATHCTLGDRVALKFLRAELLSNEEAVSRFASEARAAAMIKSDHVARVYDVGSLPEHGPFLVMELLEGRDLGQVLTERGALPRDVAVAYVLQACEALATAHASHVIHRDVKPDNLFLAKQKQGPEVVKLLDFGISKTASGEARSDKKRFPTTTLMAIGSPPYMSPEQIRAAPDIDLRTDIWSLGCVLYELLTGKVAFDAPSLMQVCSVVLERDPALLREHDPTIPVGLEAVVARCLEKDRSKRFQDIGELVLALEPFATERDRISVERCCHVLGRDPGTPRASGVRLQRVTEPPQTRSSEATLPRITLGSARAGDAERKLVFSSLAPELRWGALAAVFVLLAAVFLREIWTDERAVPSSSARIASTAAPAPQPAAQLPPNVTLSDGPRPGRPTEENMPLVAEAPRASNPMMLPKAKAAHIANVPMSPELTKTRQRTPIARTTVRRVVVPAIPPSSPPALASNDREARSLPDHQMPSPPALVGTDDVSAREATAANGSASERSASGVTPAAPPPASRAGSISTQVVGMIEPRKVSATVLSHAAEVQSCFDRAQMERVELRGNILLRATVDGMGDVTSSVTPDVFPGGARLAACIASAARHWKFPPPTGAAKGNVSYRFVFD